MRSFAVATTAFLAGASVAQETLLGSKKDVIGDVPNTGAGIGIMPLLQMLVALAIVVGLLKFAVPRLAGKVNKKLVTNINSSIRVEESANFAGGTLYIVQAKSKTLLLSVSSTGTTCLADISEAPQKEFPTFNEMLSDHKSQAPRSPAEFREVVVEIEEPLTEAERQAKSMLDRLSRFSA